MKLTSEPENRQTPTLFYSWLRRTYVKLTSEPENRSICIWYRKRGPWSPPVPTMVMARIDEDQSRFGEWWFPADAYHSDLRFLSQGLTWKQVLERTAGEDGPYLLPTYEENVKNA